MTKPEPKKPKMSQELKARPSSKQKLVGLVKRKAHAAGSKEPQQDPSRGDSDAGRGCLVSNSELTEQATGGSVAQEASQTSPAASNNLEAAISQGPRHMSTTPENGLGGAVVSGSLGLLGAYSDSEESD